MIALLLVSLFVLLLLSVPVAIAMAVVMPDTATGCLRVMVVPSPSCPLAL